MPSTNRKKKFSVKFELSPKGLIGTTIVCLCIFLWMFLLGVWAGQTILSAPPGSEKVAKKSLKKKRKVVQKEDSKKPEQVAVTIQREIAKSEVSKKSVSGSKPEPEEDPSFFSVQVGAFKDQVLAGKAVKNWRAKGYEAFSRQPESGSDPFTRVYIGRFDTIEKARGHAELLKKKEKQKPFIALVPGER